MEVTRCGERGTELIEPLNHTNFRDRGQGSAFILSGIINTMVRAVCSVHSGPDLIAAARNIAQPHCDRHPHLKR